MIFKTNNLNTLLPSLWRRSWGWGFLLLVFLALPLTSAAAKKKAHEPNDRQYWCSLAYRMAQPVLENMAKGELQKNMQTEFSPSFDNRNRKVLYMECFGRLMAGIAPWLTLPDDNTAEGKQRKQLREWALLSYKNAVEPQSADYLCWGCRQPERACASRRYWQAAHIQPCRQLQHCQHRDKGCSCLRCQGHHHTGSDA